MKLDIGFKKLDFLRRKMGADKIIWQSESSLVEKERARFKKELTEGLLISEGDFDDIEIRPDGLLSWKGHQIVIYIKDHSYKGGGYYSDSYSEPQRLNRFHLSDCETIYTMKNQERYHRYVAAQPKDNTFLIDIGNDEDIRKELLPCRNCLKKLDYNNYRSSYFSRNRIVNSFIMKDFFKLFESKFSEKPIYNEITSPSYGYAKDHAEISKKLREGRKWICEKCKVQLDKKEHHRLLHAHHINAIKNDNRDSNLQALCVLCHKEQHGHMHVPEEDKSIIEILRIMQNV